MPKLTETKIVIFIGVPNLCAKICSMMRMCVFRVALKLGRGEKVHHLARDWMAQG